MNQEAHPPFPKRGIPEEGLVVYLTPVHIKRFKTTESYPAFWLKYRKNV